MSLYAVLQDFAIASLLILIGQFLRAKIKFFQTFFVPASLIAGIIGLIGGPRILKVFPFSEWLGSYAGCFIIIVFTVVGVNGFEFGKAGGGKEEIERILSFQLYRLFIFTIQLCIPVFITMWIITPIMPELNPMFGILFASGFTGGHGTAAAVGQTCAELGWAEGLDLGITFATFGVFTGIFGGLMLIKNAAKKGYTCYIKDVKYLSQDLKTGMVQKENRVPVGMETISSVSLDTLAFHMSLILMVGGGGYMLNKYVIKAYIISGIPDFTVAYLVGLVFFLIFKKTPLYNYVDKTLNTRISGMFTDYLVCYAVASVNPTVLINYAVPLAIMTVLGIVLVVVSVVYPVGYLVNKKCWFEHSIFCFGYSTGVFAIGFVLLRIVDPENRSMTVEDTAMTPIGSFLEIFTWSLGPQMMAAGQSLTWALGWTAFSFAMLAACFVLKMWYPKKKYPLNARGGYNMPEEAKA